MIAIPLLILALAAGVYLLIKVTREYLGAVFKALAWLVIILSLLGIFALLGRGIHHFKHMHEHPYGAMMRRHCGMPFRGGMGPGGCCAGGCSMGDGCSMAAGSCCKMAGDSVVLEKGMCEKLMGKDSCAQICKQRGRCILSRDECMRLCGGGKCAMDGASPGSCCMKGGAADGMKGCCMKK